jgi:hypothetical protein
MGRLEWPPAISRIRKETQAVTNHGQRLEPEGVVTWHRHSIPEPPHILCSGFVSDTMSTLALGPAIGADPFPHPRACSTRACSKYLLKGVEGAKKEAWGTHTHIYLHTYIPVSAYAGATARRAEIKTVNHRCEETTQGETKRKRISWVTRQLLRPSSFRGVSSCQICAR